MSGWVKAAVAPWVAQRSLAEWLRGGDSGGDSQGATMVSAYSQSVWVYACINAISRQVSQIPFRFSTGARRSKNVVESGPMVDLFARPHTELDRYEFWEMVIGWLMIRGEAFIIATNRQDQVLPVRSLMRMKDRLRGASPVDSLIPISPDRMRHIVQGSKLIGWQYTAGSLNDPYGSDFFLPEEVIQIRLVNLFSFWRGLSPLVVANLPAATDYASAQFMKGLMLNNADMGLIVTTEQTPTPEQREQMMAALKERKRKAGTADRPLFMWGGSKIEKPTITSVDLQFLENRKFNRQEICAVYGVPQEMLGFNEDANRSLGVASRQNFIENTIMPITERVESGIEPIVKAFDPGLFGYFDSDSLPVMQAARMSRIDSGVKLFGLGVPMNEVNRSLDLGLPDLPHGDVSYLPFNLQEVGASGSTKPQVPNPNEAPNTNPQKAVGDIERMMSLITSAATPIEKVHVCGGNPQWDAMVSPRIRLMAGKLRKFFFEQRTRVLAKLPADKGIEPQINADGRGWGTKGIEDAFDVKAEGDVLFGKMKAVLIGDLEFGGGQLWKEIGLDASTFKVPPVRAMAYLQKRENSIKGINQTTFDSLKSSWNEGLAAGETQQQLTDRVKEIFQGASDHRAEVIASTEVNMAVNGGRHEGMVDAKVPFKGWKTSNLEGVRPSHQMAERDYGTDGIPVDQPFRVGGFDLMFPGDPSGPPQEVINCRCFSFAILDGAKGVTK